MVQEERNDSIVVRFSIVNTDGDEKYVCSFYTTAINQILKMFITAKENNIECYFNENSTVISDELREWGYHIKDVYLSAGNEEDLMSMNVILE